LEKALGIPLFQEQAMAIAIHCAGFSTGEADQLGRSMATAKFIDGVSHKDRLVQGRIANGYDRVRRADLRPAGRVRQLWLSDEPCGELRIIAYASSWAKSKPCKKGVAHDVPTDPSDLSNRLLCRRREHEAGGWRCGMLAW
jgi:error-prone DNA polymerase